MSESDVMQLNVTAPNLGVFTGVIQREPEIANVMSNNTPVRVLNFDVPVTVASHDGRNFTAYVKCSAWGEDAIAKFNAIVGHAWEKHVRVRVIGTVDASAYRMPRPPHKTIGVMRCRVLQVEELSEKAASAGVPPAEASKAGAEAQGQAKKGRAKKGGQATVAGGEPQPAASLGGAAVVAPPGEEKALAVTEGPPALHAKAKAKKKGAARRSVKRAHKPK